jgi:hypothetical protein
MLLFHHSAEGVSYVSKLDFRTCVKVQYTGQNNGRVRSADRLDNMGDHFSDPGQVRTSSLLKFFFQMLIPKIESPVRFYRNAML